MITRRAFSTGVAAGVASSVLGFNPVVQRNIVFVHGLYADGSCWSDVIVRLQAAGFRCTSAQNPLRTFADDVATLRRAISMQDGPTVLVAHSYGGMVATEAGVDPKIVSLVYIAARAPDAGEDYPALAKKFPTPPASMGLVKIGDDFLALSETAFLNDFANGVDPVKARELYAVQAPNAASLTTTAKTTVAAWRSKPTWYAVSKQDRTINPDLERFMAKRMKATTIELDAGHLSLVSNVPEVTNLILEAAGRPQS